MFTYDSDDEEKIVSCVLDDVDFNEISVEDIFPIESKWKDRSLLYSTIQAYAAATGWKATLSHSIYIRCSCYKRPTHRETSRKFTSGSLYIKPYKRQKGIMIYQDLRHPCSKVTTRRY